MKAFFLLFVVVLANVISLEPNVDTKPTIVYVGETYRSFEIIYSGGETPTETPTFTISDKQYTCTKADSTFICSDVVIDKAQVEIKDSASVIIKTLTALTGQKVKTLSHYVIPISTKTEVTITFEKGYDVLPTIRVGTTPINCVLDSDTTKVKCDFNLEEGKHEITYNAVSEDPKIIIEAKNPANPTVTPGKYYNGEEVTFTFTYPLEADVPKNIEFKTEVEDFPQCTQNKAVVSCPKVKITTDKEELIIKNKETPAVDIAKIKILQGQELTGIDKDKITQKEKSDVVLTFTKEYDLLPTISLKGKTATLSATCTLEEKKTNVKCPLTIEAVDTYTVVYNGKESKKAIEVVIGGNTLKISLIIMIVGLLF